jgi:Ulp1 family protease
VDACLYSSSRNLTVLPPPEKGQFRTHVINKPRRYQLCRGEEELVAKFREPQPGRENEVVAIKFNIPVTRKVSFRLNDREWLNDELINFWMELLNQNNQKQVASGVIPRQSVYFNSFFFFNLAQQGGYNYESVKRWTGKVGLNIFECERVFVPVNMMLQHWLLLVIEVRLREIHSFDSLGGQYLCLCFNDLC